MRGNAGAGGAMAAMASDLVWANENVILNPHYKVLLHGKQAVTLEVGAEEAPDDVQTPLGFIFVFDVLCFVYVYV